MLPLRGAFLLVLINFLLSLSVSLLAPIYPLYLKGFVHNNALVGYITCFAALILLAGALFTSKLLKKIPKFRLLMISLITLLLSNYFFMIVTTIPQLLILIFFRTLALIIAVVVIGLYVRASVKNKSTLGKTEGLYFVFGNLAWMVGPLIGGALAQNFSFNLVFGTASLFVLGATLLTLFAVPRDEELDHDGHILFSSIKDYFSKKNLLLLYFISLGLAVWWSNIYTFLPLYLAQEGIAKTITGYALFLVALPLILFEFPIGKKADKIGVKNFFTLGYFLLFIFSFFIYFSKHVYLSIALFVLACVGAAFIEPLREAYLFKKIQKKDETRFYTLYTTAFDIGALLGPLLLSSILAYSNFKIVFLTTSLVMLCLCILTRFMGDTKHEIHH